MPSAAKLKAQLLAKREQEQIEQERRDAEMAVELERLEQQEEEERHAREAEEQRVQEEHEQEERRAREQQDQTDEGLRLATPEDRAWMVKVLQARNRGELVFRGNDVTAHVRGSAAGNRESKDRECWPCRVREIECERRR